MGTPDSSGTTVTRLQPGEADGAFGDRKRPPDHPQAGAESGQGDDEQDDDEPTQHPHGRAPYPTDQRGCVNDRDRR